MLLEVLYLNWIRKGNVPYVNIELRQQMKIRFSFGRITGRFICETLYNIGYNSNDLFYCFTSWLFVVEIKGPTRLQTSISFGEKLFLIQREYFFKCLENEKSFP